MRSIVLSGQYRLLIYSKEDNGALHILNLIRTGTHADLFGK